MSDQQVEDSVAVEAVDETPISPTKEKGRKNSLEAYLQNRPDRSELVDSKKTRIQGQE